MRVRAASLSGFFFLGFAGLAALVEPGPILFDAPLLETFGGWRSETLTLVVRGVTHLGGHVVQIALGVGVGALLLWRRRTLGLFTATALLGSVALNETLKILFGRPRPILIARITEPRGLSFPSGHSQSTMAMALTLALVAQHHPSLSPVQRRAAWGLLLVPAVVGWTRNYLGVHYPTDVLAGWSLAAGWVLACYAAWLPRLRTAPPTERPLVDA
ncbi:MAG: phosphatase PAP2 family protein [Sandaracinus sp.]|nr:phosphatase PAP2 family protein [Myxococcales bacterium]MCB9600308.1 phosphatase PAP2 family protein [Sandaracinus sp.]MCB9613109.1 phosphatase PAP2 family protein [Sandaracinus sp.]MCB9632761.1 phosphatase PAP2 family protein [Sandaracinus sp.]